MRILFISPTNTSGGAERVMTLLANKFCESNEVIFMTFDKESKFYPINERVYQIRMDLVFRKNKKNPLEFVNLEIKRYKKIADTIKKMKPDIVISFLFMPNILSILACIKTKTPIIISERNDPNNYSKLKKYIMTMFYKYATGIVCQSHYIKALADKTYKIENSCVIPNPLNNEQYNVEFNKNKVHKIISIGRLVSQKNHFMTIEAFSIISEKYPSYELFIYGEGPLRKDLERRISELGLADKIHLPGLEQEVMKKNSDAMLYIMSSDFEGFPNSLVESMANGVISICTDFPSKTARDIIINEKNGFLIDIRDTNQLIKVMDKILSNPEAYIKVGYEGKKIVNQLNINTIAQQWYDFINTVVSS